MQLSTFYNVLLQLLDSLKVIGMIFLGAFKVKEASFLFLYVIIFQGGYLGSVLKPSCKPTLLSA